MRSGLLLIGIWVGVLGYAIMYNGLTGLNPSISPTGEPVGFVDGLVPGRLGGARSARSTKAVPQGIGGAATRTGPKRKNTGGGGRVQ